MRVPQYSVKCSCKLAVAGRLAENVCLHVCSPAVQIIVPTPFSLSSWLLATAFGACKSSCTDPVDQKRVVIAHAVAAASTAAGQIMVPSGNSKSQHEHKPDTRTMANSYN